MVRTCTLLALLLAGSIASADTPGTPFDPIAKAARADGADTLMLSFDESGCAILARTGAQELQVPLRTVSWSMTKDGSGAVRVTARCPKGKGCIGSTREVHTSDLPHQSRREAGKSYPRFSFVLAVAAREARKLFRDLKGFAMHCTPLAPAAPR